MDERRDRCRILLVNVPQSWLVNTLPMKVCSSPDQITRLMRPSYTAITMRHQRLPLKVRAALMRRVPQYVFPDNRQVMWVQRSQGRPRNRIRSRRTRLLDAGVVFRNEQHLSSRPWLRWSSSALSLEE